MQGWQKAKKTSKVDFSLRTTQFGTSSIQALVFSLPFSKTGAAPGTGGTTLSSPINALELNVIAA
jgi:hypothetical protein